MITSGGHQLKKFEVGGLKVRAEVAVGRSPTLVKNRIWADAEALVKVNLLHPFFGQVPRNLPNRFGDC